MKLFDSNYLSLSTRKRDGSWVATPVWFAGDDAVVYIFSAANAGKVKRLRNFAEVTVAPCTVSGKVTGAPVRGAGELLSDDHSIATAHNALLQRYGWQMRLLNALSRLSGRYHQRQFIRINLAGG
jgi:hypothetical protein